MQVHDEIRQRVEHFRHCECALAIWYVRPVDPLPERLSWVSSCRSHGVQEV